MTIRYLKYIFGVLAYVAAVALTRALLTYLGAPVRRRGQVPSVGSVSTRS